MVIASSSEDDGKTYSSHSGSENKKVQCAICAGNHEEARCVHQGDGKAAVYNQVRARFARESTPARKPAPQYGQPRFQRDKPNMINNFDQKSVSSKQQPKKTSNHIYDQIRKELNVDDRKKGHRNKTYTYVESSSSDDFMARVQTKHEKRKHKKDKKDKKEYRGPISDSDDDALYAEFAHKANVGKKNKKFKKHKK